MSSAKLTRNKVQALGICPNPLTLHGQDEQDRSKSPYYVYPDIQTNNIAMSSISFLTDSAPILCQHLSTRSRAIGTSLRYHACPSPQSPHVDYSTFQAIDAANWTSHRAILQITIDGIAGRHNRHFRYGELPIELRT